MKCTIRMTLSIGFSQAMHEETLEVDDVPEGLTEEELDEWLVDNYWNEWSGGYIEGGVEIIKREETT